MAATLALASSVVALERHRRGERRAWAWARGNDREPGRQPSVFSLKCPSCAFRRYVWQPAAKNGGGILAQVSRNRSETERRKKVESVCRDTRSCQIMIHFTFPAATCPYINRGIILLLPHGVGATRFTRFILIRKE